MRPAGPGGRGGRAASDGSTGAPDAACCAPHPRMEPIVRRTAAVAVTCALVLGACAQATDLADDARSAVDDARSQIDDVRGRLDDLVAQADEIGDRLTWCGAAVRLGTAVTRRDAQAAEAAAEDLRGSAPDELADEVRIVAEAAGRAQLGDTSVLLDTEVQDAARVVMAEARDSCGIAG